MSITVADHVILTRFNLPTAGVEGLIRARDGWLAERVDLFETYTVPSVRSQTRRPAWLVYLDPQSPSWLLDRLRPWQEQGVFTAIFRDAVDVSDLRSDLNAHVPRNHDRLLTTNLDNDDGLAVDFCERLGQTVSSAPRCVVYWPAGLIRCESNLYLRTDRRNAFCSVLESWEEPVTSWSEYHNEFGKVMPVVEVKAPPGWLQIVHGANVSNRVRGRLTTPGAYLARYGDTLAGVRTPPRPELLRDQLIGYPIRVGRDGLRAGFRVAGLSLLGKDRYQSTKAALASFRRR